MNWWDRCFNKYIDRYGELFWCTYIDTHTQRYIYICIYIHTYTQIYYIYIYMYTHIAAMKIEAAFFASSMEKCELSAGGWSLQQAQLPAEKRRGGRGCGFLNDDGMIIPKAYHVLTMAHMGSDTPWTDYTYVASRLRALISPHQGINFVKNQLIGPDQCSPCDHSSPWSDLYLHMFSRNGKQ